MTAYIALGANLPSPFGPPRATLEAALTRLAAAGAAIVRRSRWYRSPAWPDPAEPDFVNGVVAVETGAETGLEPSGLLALLHRIEDEFGRRRSRPNAPRPIDLDLLDWNGCVQGGGVGHPILPHPRLHRRGFVLVPLAEIAPDWVHPVSRRPIREMLAALPSTAEIVALPAAREKT